MLKNLCAVSLAACVLIFPVKAMAISGAEGLLYSAIGCTSVFKKLEREDKTEVMIDFIHHFSEKQKIFDLHPGYIDRFIRLVEKKWERDYDLAKKNCDGIYSMAQQASKPSRYNAVASSVIEYMADLEESKSKDYTPPASPE